MREAGHSRLLARATTAGVGWKLSSMAARGLVHRPRFRSVSGTPFIGKHVTLRGLGYVTAGARLRIDDFAEVDGVSVDGITFGDNVFVGPFTTIKPSSSYGRLVGAGLRVGDRSGFSAGCYIGCWGGVSIGSNVLFGPGVRIFAETHEFDEPGASIKDQDLVPRPVVIEDDCWIASGVTITGGVTIGRGSVVGAGSVVTKSIPPLSIAAGSPARVLKTRAGDGAEA